MEVVDVVANAQRHQKVDLGLELKHQDQIQPRIVTLLFRPTAKPHAPDHVISVPAWIFGSSGDGLFLQSQHLPEVKRVDEWVVGQFEISDFSARFLYGPRGPGLGAAASTRSTMSETSQTRSSTPASIAGVTRREL